MSDVCGCCGCAVGNGGGLVPKGRTEFLRGQVRVSERAWEYPKRYPVVDQRFWQVWHRNPTPSSW